MKKILIKAGTILVKVAVMMAAAFFLYKFSLFAYNYGYRIFAETPVDREPGIDVNVAIVEGKTVKQIGKLLEEKGLIRDGRLFVLQETFSEYSGKLNPGVYTLNTSQTPYEMMAIMAEEQQQTINVNDNSKEGEDQTEEDTKNPENDEDNPGKTAEDEKGAGGE
ncbi:MAG: endolytic transglycosylase MltG [Lachnospiraceae bacterium]|nr:endolytic transglycosylase MltG [Lachnospiraceae bacterium]